MEGFLKCCRKDALAEKLIRERPTAFLLLFLIAYRAKRNNKQTFNDLKQGEAYIGDYKSYGVTEQIYRTDKTFLEKYKLATFKPTPKGTIGKILNKAIFDINEEATNEQLTNSQRPHNDHLTTNKNEKNEKKDKNPPNPPEGRNGGRELGAIEKATHFGRYKILDLNNL